MLTLGVNRTRGSFAETWHLQPILLIASNQSEKNEMIRVRQFICLHVYPISTTPWLSQCHYDANDPSVCLLPHWPTKLYGFTHDLCNEVLGLLLLSLNNTVCSKLHFPSCLSASSQNTAWKEVLFIFFPNFSCVAALERDLLSHPFMSLACSFISLSLFPLDYSHSQPCQIKMLTGHMPWTSSVSLADFIWHSLGSSTVTCKPCQ